MTVTMPETTKSFGNESLVVLTVKPADLAAITVAEIAAGENVTCHMVGDWYPTNTVEKTARQRKMCQRKTTQALGTSTWDTPALIYTVNPQTIGTPGSDGNEAYEALPEDAQRYIVQRMGKGGTTAVGEDDAYRLWPLELGPQPIAPTADDAGGEFSVTQESAFIEGYDGPIDGVIVGES